MTPLDIHEWVYTVRGNPESSIHTGSTDRDEVAGIILATYRCTEADITLRRIT